MSTMKDVARLAGVSHGTVSNIINGAKGVSLGKVQRVEKAMKELNYKPNAMARNLKMNKTMQFDVILPNIVATSLSQIYTYLSKYAAEKGYIANLRLTNEDADLETTLLNHAQMYNIDGVILMTCQPQNSALFERLRADGLVIVFLERELTCGEYDFVGIELQNVVKQSITQLLGMGNKDIGIIVGPLEYTLDKQVLNGYLQAHKDAGIQVDSAYCAVASYDRESAFKEAIRILTAERIPSTIITSCTQSMEAILKAIEVLAIDRKDRPLVLALVPSSWTVIKRDGVITILLPYTRITEAAFNLLLNRMNGHGSESPEKIMVRANPINLRELLQGAVRHRPQTKKVLRVLLTVDKAKYAIETLVENFENETGYRVEIEAKKYSNMYRSVRDEWYKSDYDVFDLDIPWVGELAQNKVIQPLDEYLKGESEYEIDTPVEIFNEYCMHDGLIYGLPLTICLQLLFYRKDYFNDVTMQRMFYEQYKQDLRPPRTWQEFNKTARFFTKEFNPYSPTEYGTTLGSRISSGGTCEYLPRLWAFGGEIYDDTGFTLNSEQAIAALENYKESFKYASKESVDNWWPEQACEFRDGKSAMMMTYADNIIDVTERAKSEIIGKIGYDFVPGRVNVKGGWVLSVNAHSKNKPEAVEFIKWACSKELSVISTILGGFVPCRTSVENLEVANIYPWIRKMLEAHRYGRMRELPTKKDGRYMCESWFESIIGEAVHNAVTHLLSPKTALDLANARLNRMLCQEDD